MPSISAGRIQSGTGAITFSTSTTATAGGTAPPASSTSVNTTLSLVTPSTGVRLFDSLVQSTPAVNNLTLSLRNLVAGSNITITDANGMITIGTTGSNNNLVSSTDGIAAGPASTQSTATVLPTTLNRLTTVAAADGSVQLPAAIVGLQVTVINATSTNAVLVYPSYNSGSPVDVIDGGSATTGFAVAATKSATFFCASSGQWNTLLSA